MSVGIDGLERWEISANAVRVKVFTMSSKASLYHFQSQYTLWMTEDARRKEKECKCERNVRCKFTDMPAGLL